MYAAPFISLGVTFWLFVWTPCCSSSRQSTPSNSPVVPPGFISVPIRMQTTGKKKGKKEKKGKTRDSRDSTTMHFLLDTSLLPRPPPPHHAPQDTTSSLSDTSDFDPPSPIPLPSPPRAPRDPTLRHRFLRLVIWDTIFCIFWLGIGLGSILGGQKCPAGTGGGWWFVPLSRLPSRMNVNETRG